MTSQGWKFQRLVEKTVVSVATFSLYLTISILRKSAIRVKLLSTMDTKEFQLYHVLMFPWLAHGHISPYLELAKKLSQRNFKISFCSTPINISSIKKQLDEKIFPSIQLVKLHLPSLPDLPTHYQTTKSLPPHLMSRLKEAFDMAERDFSELLKVLKPDLLIYDFPQPWAPAAASRESIPAIHFRVTAAASSSYFFDIRNNGNFPFSSVYLHPHEYHTIINMLPSSSTVNGVLQCYERSHGIILIRTFREIEAKYIDYLSLQVGKAVVPVGPLIQESSSEDENSASFFGWLSGKEKSSVVFASFGSEYFLSKEEIEQIAFGLELSKANFIFVVRFPEGKSLELDNVLPQGFLARIGERGLVLKDWAPQARILSHSSIGGFVSHCGWSSVMEGIYYGVPIIAMPMHYDQPLNARLVVELVVGKEVDGESGRYTQGEITKTIDEVLVEKGGHEVRRKVKEISEKMRRKGEEEIDVVVTRLVEVCTKSRSIKN